MEIKADLHTHTIASGHYTDDTVWQLAKRASEIKLEYLGITDHSFGMVGGAKEGYFNTLKMLSPNTKYGVKLLYGAEVNVMDYEGKVDLSDSVMKKLDYTIASMHPNVIKPSSEYANTSAIVKVMENKLISIVGHVANCEYEVSFPLVADKARETGTIIELNSSSLGGYRGDESEIVIRLLKECKKYGTYISLGSDSHGVENVGNFQKAIELLDEIDYPKDKIVNCDIDLFLSLVNKKRK